MASIYEDIDRRFQVDPIQPSERISGEWFPKMFAQMLPTIFRQAMAVKRQEGIDKRASMWDAWKMTTTSVMASKDVNSYNEHINDLTTAIGGFEEGSVEYNRLSGARDSTITAMNNLISKQEQDRFKAEVAGHGDLFNNLSKNKLVDDEIFGEFVDGMEEDLYGMDATEFIADRKFEKEEYVDAKEDDWINNNPSLDVKDMPDFGEEWEEDDNVKEKRDGMVGLYESNPKKHAYLLPYIERMEGLLTLSDLHQRASDQWKSVDELLANMHTEILDNADNKEWFAEGEWKKLLTDIQENKKANFEYWDTQDTNAFEKYISMGKSLDAGYTGLNYLDSVQPDLKSVQGRAYADLARRTISENIDKKHPAGVRLGLTYLDNIIISEKSYAGKQEAFQKEQLMEYKKQYNDWQKSEAVVLSGDLQTLQEAVQGLEETSRHKVYKTGPFALMTKPASGWDRGTVSGKISPTGLTALKTRLANEATKLIQAEDWIGNPADAPDRLHALAKEMQKTGTVEDTNAFIDELLKYDSDGYDFDYVGTKKKDKGAMKIMKAIGETLKTINGIEDAGAIMHPAAGWNAPIGVSSEAEDDRDIVGGIIDEIKEGGATDSSKVIEPTSSDTTSVDSSQVDFSSMDSVSVEAAIQDTSNLAKERWAARYRAAKELADKERNYATQMAQLKLYTDDPVDAIQQTFDEDPEFYKWAIQGRHVNPDIYTAPSGQQQKKNLVQLLLGTS